MDSNQLMVKDLQLVSYKDFSSGELSFNEESRTISGYASVFNYRDHDKDVILPGAFSRSIKQRGPNSATKGKIAFLYQHNMQNPLGRITKLVEDSKGLYFEAVIDAIPEGDRLITQLKSGTINQFSIGHKYIKAGMKYDQEQDTYFIKDLDLFEISAVTLGSNDATEFLGFKGEGFESDPAAALDLALRSLSIEDEFEMRKALQIYLKSIQKEPIKENSDNFDYKLLFSNIKLI